MSEDPFDNMGQAAKKLGPEYYQAFRRAMRGDEDAIVELTVLTIQAGDAEPAEFLALPAHLPDGEKEQRLLVMSVVAADKELKDSLMAWARDNRDRGDKAAKTLETIAHAYQRAVTLAENPNVDPVIVRWGAALVQHVWTRYRVNLDQLGDQMTKSDVEAWSLKIAHTANPSPEWLITGAVSSSAFTPTPRSGRAKGFGPRAYKDRDD